MKKIENLKISISNSSLENKNELLEIIKDLEGSLKNKKYGLIWEDKPEKIEESLKNKFIYLVEDKERRIQKNVNKKENILIEGDNLESLMALQYTHKNKVTCIEIDVPYNTGNKDFIYNDRYIDKEDSWKHSSWLSFISKRLKLAKELLSEDGAIFIHIDEYEFAQLKLLCDEIFGENNFVENFIWIKNSTKNNSTTTSTNHEYVLCYAKNINLIKANSDFFRVKKDGFDEVMKIKEDFLKNEINEYKNPHLELQERIRNYYKENKHLKGINMYKYVDEKFNIYRLSDLSAPGKNGKTYDVIHPLTKKVCKAPSGGWRYSEHEFNKKIIQDRIIFGKNEEVVPGYKRFLDDVKTNVCKSIIDNYEDGEKELQNIFNTKKSPFTNPKPVSLIKYLISLVDNKNGIYLDFFAGSGTTGQAVIELNKVDNGNRQFILCTNNENNICEEVTYKRLFKVINGYENLKGKNVDGIPANLRYYRTEKIEKTNNSELDQFNLLNKTSELVQIKENTFNISNETSHYSIINNNEKTIGLYSFGIIDYSKIEEMLNTLINNDKKEKVAYIPVENISEVYDFVDDKYIEAVRFEKLPKELIDIYNKLNRN